MTTAASHARENRFNWVGHHAWALACTWIVTTDVLRYSGDAWRSLTVLRISLVAVYLAVMVLGLRHDRLLCERCIADWPLDGSRRAEQRRPALRTYHFAVRHHILFSALIVVIAAPTLILRHGWVEVLSSLGVDALLLALFGVTLIYRRLQPWCPQCQGGGGGPSEVVIPDPVPTATGSR